VAARAGIATVQRAIRNAATTTIVHEQAFTGVIDGARMIALGVEEVEPLDREAAREALGLDDRFVALCFGFVAPYKGIDIALEAARLAGPSVRLVVAGGEHPRMSGTNSYADELRRRYSETAHFTGWVDDGDVARWFAAADLALFPYPRPFSSSGVLALALAYRTPFLLSPALARCAGAPSIVSAPVEPVALAERLKLLASKPEALDQLRWWADVLASGRRWPEVAAEHEALYRELTDG
jgi:glycosyltransferase involved in cell wall biosynthesis